MFDDTKLRKAHMQSKIIAFAFFFTLLVYAGLGEFFLADLDIGIDSSVHGILRYIFMAVAAVEIVAMVILRNRILSAESIAVPQTGAKEEVFLQRLRSAHIIACALCESIAIYGLVLLMLGKDKTEFYAFLGVAFFMMMVNFPKFEDWKSRLEDFLNN